MLCKILAVRLNKNVLQLRPPQDEKAISPACTKHHKHTDKVRVGFIAEAAQDLPLTLKLNLDELANIKLPCVVVDRFHLNHYMSAELTRGDYVVMGDVAGERRSNEVSTAEFGSN